MKENGPVIDFLRKNKSSLPLTLGAFILLWWLAETARARYVMWPWALFDFFPGGAFDPVRTATCLACLLPCLFLGLTERGGRLRARVESFSLKRGAPWVFSLLATAVFFVWAMRVTVVSFMTNDDTAILKTLATIPTYGLGAASNSFTNIVFCALLGPLYSLDPEGWWYAGYHLAALFCACVVLGRCVLLKTRRRGWSVWLGCSLCLLLYAGAVLPALAQLSFTVTPAVVGSAAAALVFCRDEAGTAPGRAASDVGSVALMFLCYIHRPATGLCLMCFWGLAVVYQAARTLLRRERARARQLMGLAAAAVCVPVIFGVCRAVDNSEENYDAEYHYHDHYRSVVMDYLADDLTVEQLEAVGLPEELGSLLLRQWYFMDERVNTDTFKAITELYYHPVQTEEAESVSDWFSRLLGSYMDEPSMIPRMLYQIGATAALAALVILTRVRRGRAYWLELLCGVCALAGALILCVYLMAQGRFLYRVFLVVDIPALVMLTLCALSAPEETPRPAGRRGAAIPAGSLVLALCVLVGAIICKTPYATRYADRGDVFYEQWQIESYATRNSELLFITNAASSNLDPFHGGTYPSNVGLWGGTGVTASENRLYADAFFRDDVRFMCSFSGVLVLLLQYLSLDQGPVAALEKARLTDDISVFDLERLTPDDNYTGWYEWGGLKYYFENGRALSGTQVIDGVEYEFAPAGKTAPVNTLMDGGDKYFITTAYSLISQGEG